MLNNKLIIVLIVLLVLVGGYYFLFRSPEQPRLELQGGQEQGTQIPESSSLTPPPEEPVNDVEGGQPGAPAITYTDSGFSPNILTVKAGQEVVFINKSSRDFWPATAVHPTHQVYPGSDIQKCFSGQSEGIFDACKPINPGSSWTFVFEHKGAWKYHDHLNPVFTGTLKVE